MIHHKKLVFICFSLLFIEIRPALPNGGPVVVDFNVFIVDINSINVEDMDFRQIF